MSIGVVYIVFGAIVLAWRRWLIAKLRDVNRMVPPARRRYVEALSRHRGPKRVFAAVWVCAIAFMVVGAVSLLKI